MEIGKKQSNKPIYITFTDLFRIKQKGLEELLEKHGSVYIQSKVIGIIKVTLAELK